VANRPQHRSLVALTAPRHAAQPAAEGAAPHRAPEGRDLPIEGARNHAHVISTGALAVFRAFWRRSASCSPADTAGRPQFVIFHNAWVLHSQTGLYRLCPRLRRLIHADACRDVGSVVKMQVPAVAGDRAPASDEFSRGTSYPEIVIGTPDGPLVPLVGIPTDQCGYDGMLFMTFC
jgi:hypothetical protein